MTPPSRTIAALLAIFFAVFIWSGIHPHDYPTWILEVFPAIFGLGVMAATYRRFPLTTMLYVLILLHAIVLMVGGHYTYAEVPLGNWVRDHYHLARNDYDRVGHFMQGFVPAMVAREVLVRNRVVQRRGGWLSFLVFAICMMITALYELLEFAVAVASGSGAVAFLATQGDIWDTQKDMLVCMIGALAALALLSRSHDRAMAKLEHGARSAA
jgi:putative membrane protein